jgi:hypothetical protein
VTGHQALEPIDCAELVQRGARELFKIEAKPHPPTVFFDIDGARHDSPVDTTFPLYALSIPAARFLYPNVALPAPDVLLDSNLGFTSTEMCDHFISDYPLVANRRERGFEFALRRTEFEEYRVPAGGAWIYLCAIPNYSAWLLGELPRLLLSQRRIGKARVILHGPVQRFHLDALHEAGIPDSDIVHVAPTMAVAGSNVTWVTPTFFHHMPHPEAVALLRNGQGGRRRGSRRIYAARSGVATRRLVNEAQLERVLEDSFGFEVVRPEALTYGAQRQLLSESSILAAPFGAALANSVFMAEGGAVVVLETKRTLEFVRLAAQLSLTFVAVPTESWPVRRAVNISQSHVYGVKPSALAKGIEVAMSLLQASSQ